jgi:hypothetical protein
VDDIHEKKMEMNYIEVIGALPKYPGSGGRWLGFKPNHHHLVCDCRQVFHPIEFLVSLSMKCGLMVAHTPCVCCGN